MTIDIGVFNKVNNYLAFVEAYFEYSGAGNIKSRRFTARAVPALPYNEPNDPKLLGF
jgi:hypothetical protein